MATRSEEIEREIEATRRDMSRTVGAIERRLSPDGIMDGVTSWLKTSPRGRAVMDDVTEVVARNPLPLVLIGIGLGWLAWEMTGGGRRTLRGHRPPEPEDLVGVRRGGRSAREAADAFRDMDRGFGGDSADRDRRTFPGTGGNADADRSGPGYGAGSYLGEGDAGAGTPRAGEPGGPGYGPSVTPRAGGAGTLGAGGAPDPDTLTGRRTSGERAQDAAAAFDTGDRETAGGAGTVPGAPGVTGGRFGGLGTDLPGGDATPTGEAPAKDTSGRA